MSQDHPPLKQTRGRPIDYEVENGTITVHLDYEGFSFHVTATEDYSPSTMAAVLEHQRNRGLVPMYEHDPVVLEDGRVRMYLTPHILDADADADDSLTDTTLEVVTA
ncbi:hypothetical protein BI024_gp32 [Streptomyces phage Nanodon]|uniref:Uncharacterized protein n=1 Tax=Streptomyces phage Nanodon TaxID=1873777 RepID=A0A1B1PA96_9CAUD|nr:hypothetical protein BI024_gp32 [Streptomyces phage Nanodon]ANT41082.1 hypothetical protein SEA_NANODON_32 [Streptomyces phage Nanodon]